MSEPIVERIAQWLLAALQEITVAGGYHYTLAVTRPVTAAAGTDTFEDLTAFLEQDEAEEVEGTLTHCRYRRPWLVSVTVLNSTEAGVSTDQRINRIVGDIALRIGREKDAHKTGISYCGGLAYELDCGPERIFVDRQQQASVVVVPIFVAYETLASDPYNQ